jgi:hypothetical protein
MLAVVNDQQQVLGGEKALDRLIGRLAPERDDCERTGDCRGNFLRSLHRRERDEVRAIGEVELDCARSLEREPCLANPTRSGQGQ